MKELIETIEKFQTGVINGHIPEGLIKPKSNGLDTFNIYINNAKINLLNSIKITFPLTVKLLHENYINYVFNLYLTQSNAFPVSANLNLYGYGFIEFLSRELSKHPQFNYVEDFMEYEWKLHQSYLARQNELSSLEVARRIHGDVLKQINTADHVLLGHSKYDLESIVKLINNEIEAINNINNEVYYIIYRKDNIIMTKWCIKEFFDTFKLIEQEHNLYSALQILKCEQLVEEVLMWSISNNIFDVKS